VDLDGRRVQAYRLSAGELSSIRQFSDGRLRNENIGGTLVVMGKSSSWKVRRASMSPTSTGPSPPSAGL